MKIIFVTMRVEVKYPHRLITDAQHDTLAKAHSERPNVSLQGDDEMSKAIFTTLRVQEQMHRGSPMVRDASERGYVEILQAAGFLPILVSNADNHFQQLLKKGIRPDGILLTGGNDLCVCGTKDGAPERDALERVLVSYAIVHGTPLLGVCRGMQVLQDCAGVKLERVEGHSPNDENPDPTQMIWVNSERTALNSYHNWGARVVAHDGTDLEVWAYAEDGVAEAVRHKKHPNLVGVMWHLERRRGSVGRHFPEDVEFYRTFFEGRAAS